MKPHRSTERLTLAHIRAASIVFSQSAWNENNFECKTCKSYAKAHSGMEIIHPSNQPASKPSCNTIDKDRADLDYDSIGSLIRTPKQIYTFIISANNVGDCFISLLGCFLSHLGRLQTGRIRCCCCFNDGIFLVISIDGASGSFDLGKSRDIPPSPSFVGRAF